MLQHCSSYVGDVPNMILEGELNIAEMDSLTLSEKAKCPVCRSQIDGLIEVQVRSMYTSINTAIYSQSRNHHANL